MVCFVSRVKMSPAKQLCQSSCIDVARTTGLWQEDTNSAKKPPGRQQSLRMDLTASTIETGLAAVNSDLTPTLLVAIPVCSREDVSATVRVREDKDAA